MKGMITTLFLVMTIAGFSQQLTYRSGGNVYEGDNKLSSDQVRSVLANNSEALSLYNGGRNKKTWGNVLFYGGTSLVVANLVVGLTKDDTSVSYPGNGYNPSHYF